MSDLAPVVPLAINFVAAVAGGVMRPTLRRATKHAYSAPTTNVKAKPFMVEALAVWWGDLTSLTVGVVAAMGAAFLSDGWVTWATGLLAAAFFAAFIEATQADPYEYETGAVVQRVLGSARRWRGKKPPDNPIASSSLLLSGASTILGAALLLGA